MTSESVWTQPSWRAEADAWIRAEAERHGLELGGTIEQPHVRPWSTVLRVTSTDGPLYFKASAPVQAFEVPLLQMLIDEFGDRLPPVLSFDRERAWMLMHDGGTMLRDLVRRVEDLEHWVAAVPLYAEVQLAATVRADELLRIGVPDLRLGRLPSEFASLVERAEVTNDERAALRRLVPRVEELCEELGHDEIGATLQHNDLHSHNVLVRDGRYRLFDWGDSSISHPFQTMRITLLFASQAVGLPVDSAALQRVRDAYLEPWAGVRSRQELLRSFALAQRVGGVSDVLTEDRTDTAAGIDPPPDDPRSIPSMLRGLLAEL